LTWWQLQHSVAAIAVVVTIAAAVPVAVPVAAPVVVAPVVVAAPVTVTIMLHTHRCNRGQRQRDGEHPLFSRCGTHVAAVITAVIAAVVVVTTIVVTSAATAARETNKARGLVHAPELRKRGGRKK